MAQGLSHISALDAASGLGWLVSAGADRLVTEASRNWLAAAVAPPRPAVAAPIQRALTPGPPTATTSPATALAVAAAAAAPDLAALDTALIDFAHPLRRTDAPPQLLTGNIASGLIILADQPDPAGSPADRLTERMLASIGLTGESCARAHLLPWPTPGARPPKDDELAAFAPFRARAFQLASPRLILAFGDRAAGLSGQIRGIAASRGKWFAIDGTPMLATFHPRILLNQPELKRLAWADLQAFAAQSKAI